MQSSFDSHRGVWELHRLSRETVLEWLSKRREADGIVSSTQKRRPEKRRGGGSALYIEDGEFQRDERHAGMEDAWGRESTGLGPGSGRMDRGSRKDGKNAAFNGGGENVLMSLMSDVVSRDGGSANNEAQVPAKNETSNYQLSANIEGWTPRIFSMLLQSHTGSK